MADTDQGICIIEWDWYCQLVCLSHLIRTLLKQVYPVYDFGTSVCLTYSVIHREAEVNGEQTIEFYL